MSNRLCKVLGIEKPVIQGPMSWGSTAPLSAAVSEAGCLGVLGTAAASPDFIADQISKVKEKTGKPFAINMGLHPAFLPEDYFTATLEILKREKVAAVHLDTLCSVTHRLEAAFARPFFERWKAAGIKILAKVFTMQDAEAAQAAGADVIIVKGWEGGGHGTMQSTMVLVPQAADVARVPLVASGGIADGRGMAAAMVMGADGIEMGTAFLAAEETAIHPDAKRAVLDAGDFTTVEVGFSAGEPCRQIRNALSDEVYRIETDLPAAQAKDKVIALTQNSLRLAMQEGDVQHGAVMAGQIVGLVRAVRPAREIVDSTCAQCEAILKNASALALH